MQTTQLTQRQTEIMSELKARYQLYGKDSADYRVFSTRFECVTPTEKYIGNDGFVYDLCESFLYEELEAIAHLTNHISYVENTQIAMFANEHVLIHASILEFEPVKETPLKSAITDDVYRVDTSETDTMYLYAHDLDTPLTIHSGMPVYNATYQDLKLNWYPYHINPDNGHWWKRQPIILDLAKIAQAQDSHNWIMSKFGK